MTFASATSAYVGSLPVAFFIIEIIELFWSVATIVSVPFALLMRCRPRSLPGVRPRP
jgi:hypothetical protein